MASSLGMLSSKSPSTLCSVTEHPGPTGSEPSAGQACTDPVPSRDLVGSAAGRAGREGKDPGFLAHSVSHLWGGDGTAARVPGVSVTAAALTRDRAGEAESRRPRPHTVLMGPDYSTSCGGNSKQIRREKWGALGIRQHHPTATELGTPRPASPREGSRTSRVWPHPSRHTPGVPSSGGRSGASSCAWGLPEDFPDRARPRARAACPSGGFQGFPGSRQREPHARPSGAFPEHGAAVGAHGDPRLGASPCSEPRSPSRDPGALANPMVPTPPSLKWVQMPQPVASVPSTAAPAMRTAHGDGASLSSFTFRRERR